MMDRSYNRTQYGKRSLQFPISQEIPLNIVGSTVFGRYPKISPEETFNMMISDDTLVSFAGYQKVATIAKNGEARGIYASDRYNHLIVVVDNGLYTVDTNNGVSRIDSLQTSSGTVYIAENLAGEIAIADGLNIYIFNYVNNTFTVPTIDFLPVYIAFQDTYFIAADGRTNQWRLSDNNNGTSWPADAAHVGELQSKPTYTVATVPLEGNVRSLFIFGSNVGEPWYDQGAGQQLFPYVRNNYFSLGYGTISAATIDTNESKMVWLGSNEKSGLALMYSEGGAPQKISTDGIDFKLASITNPADSFGFLFRESGHVFYQLTFKTDNITYVYDFNLNKFYTLTDKNLNCHIAKKTAFFNNKNYFVSFVDGDLYELSSQYTTYNGDLIPRKRKCKNIRIPSGDNVRIGSVTVTMEQGINDGLERMDLSLSKDGGNSFGNVSSIKLNPYGKRPNRMNWYSLGIANDFVTQFDFWSSGRLCVVGASATVSQ